MRRLPKPRTAQDAEFNQAFQSYLDYETAKARFQAMGQRLKDQRDDIADCIITESGQVELAPPPDVPTQPY